MMAEPENGVNGEIPKKKTDASSLWLFERIFAAMGIHIISSKQIPKKVRRLNFFQHLHFLWCLLVVSVEWCNAINRIAIDALDDRKHAPGAILFSIAGDTYFLGVAMFSMAHLITSSKYITVFKETMLDYHLRYGPAYDAKNFSRRINITVTIAITTALTKSALFGYFMKHGEASFGNTQMLFVEGRNSYWALATLILNILAGVHAGVFCSVMLVFVAVMCIVLFKEFTEIGEAVKMKYDVMTEEFERHLNQTRMRFERLCDILEKFDCVVFCFLVIMYPLFMVMLCFCLYVLANNPNSEAVEENILMASYLMLLAVLFLGGISLIGAVLNSKIHEPLSYLYRLDVRNMSERSMREVSLFSSRLAGPPLGISVGGMFILDKSAILMVLGTILAYTIVVLQIGPPKECGERISNSTL